VFRVNRADIHYLRTTIEAYDGMAVVRTVEPHCCGKEFDRATIELLIAPGCEDLISGLIASLKEQESLYLEPIPV
jgi:hypothetical protein